MSPSLEISICLALVVGLAVQAQELQLQQQNYRQQLANRGLNQTPHQTLVMSLNPNGQGIRVIDRATNRQLVDTNALQEVEGGGGADNQLDDRLVGGLLEWFEKLKEKKRRKKEGKKEDNKQPIILPVLPPERKEPREIHIHINNHIKKHGQRQHKKHNKKHGHYEDYHDGHYDLHDHDKHYHGKHSYPLLSHHFDLGDLHEHYLSTAGGQHHQGHDDYSGYESKQVARYSNRSAELRSKARATGATTQAPRRQTRARD